MTITWPDPATDIKTSKHFTSKHKTSPAWNGRRLVHSKEMIWASRWSVALRAFYRQILSALYSSFPFGNFSPRLVRALLVYTNCDMCRFNSFCYPGSMLVYFFGVSRIVKRSYRNVKIAKVANLLRFLQSWANMFPCVCPGKQICRTCWPVLLKFARQLLLVLSTS